MVGLKGCLTRMLKKGAISRWSSSRFMAEVEGPLLLLGTHYTFGAELLFRKTDGLLDKQQSGDGMKA